MKIKYYIIVIIFVFLSFFCFRYMEIPERHETISPGNYWVSNSAWADDNNTGKAPAPYKHKQMTEEEFNKKKTTPKKKKTAPKPIILGEKKTTLEHNQTPKINSKDPGFILNKTDDEVYNDPVFDSVDIDWILVPPDKFKKEDLIKPPKPGEIIPDEILTIDRSVDIAVARNAQLRQAKEKVEQSVAQYKQLKSAKNPTMQIDAAAVKQGPDQKISLPFPFDTTILFQRDYMYYGQASLQYLITTFGNIENQISAAFVNIRVTRENYETSKTQIIYNVRESFYNILKAIAMVQVMKDNIKSTEDHLKNARSLYENGIVSKKQEKKLLIGLIKCRK